MLECSPPARQRRAAVEANGSNESLLSEETSAENAWPWSKTAGGGYGNGDGHGDGREIDPLPDAPTVRYDCPPEGLCPTRPAYVI